jgi:hypothetical protein
MTLDKTPVPPIMDGFEFKQREEPINWRTIASMDVDRIIKTVIINSNAQRDIPALQSIVDNLTFCNISGNFGKITKKSFKMWIRVI